MSKNKITVLALIVTIILIVGVTVGVLLIKKKTNINPRAQTSTSDNMKLALRVPVIEVYNVLKQYQDGTKASIPFIFYGRIEIMEQLNSMGATGGSNPAELGVLVGCDEASINTVKSSISRYRNANITYIMQDCEKGEDNLWSSPDVPSIVSALKSTINANPDFRWQVAMQFGYLENTYGSAGGDMSVCSDRNLSSCDIARSYAGLVWQNYNQNDIFSVFGQSRSQDTADNFEAINLPWINFMRQNYPNNDWWGISGLTDKDKNGIVDYSPQEVYAISRKAKQMGASAFGVIWLGRTAGALFSPATEMDIFLDLWAQNSGAYNTSTPNPTIINTPISHTPNPTATSTPISFTPNPTIYTPLPTGLMGDISIKVKIQGVTDYGRSSQFIVEFISDGDVKFRKEVVLTSAADGVYTIEILGSEAHLTPGLYDIRIKTNSHLAKRYRDVQIGSTNLNLDYSQNESDELRLGDVDSDNKLGLSDLSIILSYYTSLKVEVDYSKPRMVNSDVDKDGYITIADLALVMINWSAIVILGE